MSRAGRYCGRPAAHIHNFQVLLQDCFSPALYRPARPLPGFQHVKELLLGYIILYSPINTLCTLNKEDGCPYSACLAHSALQSMLAGWLMIYLSMGNPKQQLRTTSHA